MAKELEDITMQNVRLAKLGGYCTENDESRERSAQIVSGEYDGIPRRIVVVSAPKGVTNKLIDLANYHLGEKDGVDTRKELPAHYPAFVHDILQKHLKEGLAYSTQNPAEFIDQLAIRGELIAAPMFAKLLEQKGKRVGVMLPDDWDFKVTSEFGDARVLEDHYQRMGNKLREALRDFDILVLSGYGGKTLDGKWATLKRGGTDTAANAAGASSGVGLIENWKDEPAIFRVSPTIKDNGFDIKPEPIDIMIYREGAFLFHGGMAVLHPDSIKPVEDKSIPVWVRGFKHPEHPGTRIIAYAAPTSLVTGIAYRGGSKEGLVSISYTNPYDPELQYDFITELRHALSERGIRPAFITAENRETLYDRRRLDETKLNEAKRDAINRLKERRPDLSISGLDKIKLDVTDGISLVSVVGRGMEYDRRTSEEKMFEGERASGVGAKTVLDEAIRRVYLVRDNPLVEKPENAMRLAVEIYKQFFPIQRKAA